MFILSQKKKIFRDLKSGHKELKRVEIPEVDLDKLIELGYYNLDCVICLLVLPSTSFMQNIFFKNLLKFH